MDICLKNKVKTCSIVNVVESTIARNSDWVLPIHAGPEIVASTKAFLGQLIVLYILCLKISFERKDIDKKNYIHNIDNLKQLPESIEKNFRLRNRYSNNGEGIFKSSWNNVFRQRKFISNSS